MHRLISTRTASHALRAARPLLQAPQTFAFSTLPRGTHLLTASQIQQQLRNYSPRKIKRDPYGAASQEQQQNTSYYEPENVTYSYPQYTSAAPPPGSVLQYSDGIANILSQPCLVMERKMEFMNVFLGFEQANRYAILDIAGNHLGYMEEEDFGIAKAVLRQVYRLHRPFSVRVLDRHGEHVLTIKRNFSLINSRIKALLPTTTGHEPIIVGESKQQWHLWRRRYNLFLYAGDDTYDQFGAVDAPILAFTFNVNDEQGSLIGSVDRNWVGLGRELFTDTGVYILKMEPSTIDPDIYINNPGLVSPVPMTLDQRAVLLSTAVSIDFDYFSRHSGRGGMFSFNSYE